MSQKIKTFCLAMLIIVLGWNSLPAQLPQDVEDVFERMIDDLDDDLAEKFEEAIEKDTATVEFTPEQFRRFRDNPINPFDGLDGIDASDGGGNIALKFELPSLRGRPLSRYERQHDNIRRPLGMVVGSAASSTVRIFGDQKHVAMGIIISTDGLLVTKASEVENEQVLFCQLPNGRKRPAKIIRVDKPNDIALISIKSSGLNPIQWSTTQPLLGAFVLTPDVDGSVMSIGSYSTTPRSTISGEQAFLGVQPQTTKQGVLISDVRPGNASHKAGLKDGDIIFRLGDQVVRDVADLVRQIRNQRPGDRIAIEFIRDGIKNKVHAELAGRNISGERAARFKMMNRLGTIPSRRGDGFPHVFQHDTPLFPEQCGGPIVDLDGNVLGINIARGGRAASYAIPSNHMLTVIENLKRQSVASREKDSIQN